MIEMEMIEVSKAQEIILNVTDEELVQHLYKYDYDNWKQGTIKDDEIKELIEDDLRFFRYEICKAIEYYSEDREVTKLMFYYQLNRIRDLNEKEKKDYQKHKEIHEKNICYMLNRVQDIITQ